MPPSGFNTMQAEEITNFLRSCWTALREEGEVLGESPTVAICRELKTIHAISETLPVASLVIPTLETIRTFYERISLENPSSYEDAGDVADAICNAFFYELLAIDGHSLLTQHIPQRKTAQT